MNVISFQLDFSTAEEQQIPGSHAAFVLFGAAPGQLPPGLYRVVCGELYRVREEEPPLLLPAVKPEPDPTLTSESLG